MESVLPWEAEGINGTKQAKAEAKKKLTGFVPETSEGACMSKMPFRRF